jgi:hypothetical protein
MNDARLTLPRGRAMRMRRSGGVATFGEVFQYTMFFQAGRGGNPNDLGVSPFQKPPIPAFTVSDTVALTQAVWHFEHEASTAPQLVKNLTCIARGMGNGRMTVAKAITFESARIVTVKGTDIDLPLTPAFRLQHAYLKTGKLAANGHFLYPLQAQIDQSMVVTFGYEFAGGPGSPPTTIAKDALESADFMPNPSPSANQVGAGQQQTVVVGPLRVLVFVSLMTGKERADFEPGGILGAGRVWPHVMIMANWDIAQASAVIHVERPSSLTMDGGDHSKHADMNNGIEAAFFADNNAPPLLPGSKPSPFWDDLFDVTELGKSTGTVRAVDPAEKGGAITGAIQRLNTDGVTYRAASIVREKRQGAYDNTHVAPTMRSSATPTEPPDFQLKKIYMAPFCEHDCLHTHWRWSKDNKLNSVFGWAATGKDPRVPGEPYKVVGTPMVAHNQTVDVESTSLSSFKYRAKAVGLDGIDSKKPIPAGTFSTFFHHGMAYAIALNSNEIKLLDALIDSKAVKDGEPSLGVLNTAVLSNAVRYWRLRFGGDDAVFSQQIVNERLKVIDRAKVLARVP